MISKRIATIEHNEQDGRRVGLLLVSNYQEGWHWIEDEEHNHICDCSGYIDAVAKLEHLYRSVEWDLRIEEPSE